MSELLASGKPTKKHRSGKRKVSGGSRDDANFKAAILIQKWYRKYQARLESRRRATWQVFQSLEYSTEKDQMSLYNFFNDLLLHSQGDDNAVLQALRRDEKPQEEDDLLADTNPETIGVDSNYKGPVPIFPLEATQLPELSKFFQNGGKLHVKYTLAILHETRKLLKGMASWNQVPLGNVHHVTVVGDLHGQMDDMQLIFYKNGAPDRKNPYVFNGDFVDRGDSSIEVALLLFSYFLVYPKSVFINRGNHEDQVMNLRYGFVKECMDKYHDQSAKVVKLFAEVFSWLPFCTVIDKKVLVCHGGISNKTNLSVVDKIERHKYMSVLNPPQEDESDKPADEKINFLEWRQILDMLWSDPKASPGCEPNTFRGGGCYFGPDILEQILKKHKFKSLIRSHECKPEGFEYCHNGQCLTLFSASNYYEEHSNKGAYAKVTKEYTRADGELEIHQFIVRIGSKIPSNSRKVTKTEDAALASLKEKCYSMKPDLMREFIRYDKDRTGLITTAHWSDTMRKVLALDIPWRTMKNRLVKGEYSSNQSLVRYETLFDDLKLENKGSDTSNMAALYKHRQTLVQIFNAIDKDRSGFISRKEFVDACKIIKRATKSDMTDSDIKLLAKSIDVNQDGQIDVNEFLDAFKLAVVKL